MTEPYIVSISPQHNTFCCHTTDDDADIFNMNLDFVPICVACSQREIFVGGDDPNKIAVFNFCGEPVDVIPLNAYPFSIGVEKSGLKLAAGLQNGTLSICAKNDETWVTTNQWQASERAVVSIVWLNDREVCSGGWDGSMSVFDSETGEPIKCLQSSGSRPIYNMCLMTLDSQFIVLGREEGFVRKYNLDDGSMVEFNVDARLTFETRMSEDNSIIITRDSKRAITAFDSESFVEKWRYKCLNFPTSIVVVKEQVFVGVYDSFVIVLNVNTGELIRRYETKFGGKVNLTVQASDSQGHRFKFAE